MAGGANGGGDLVGRASRLCVVTAHNALLAGEFDNGGRHEVGLGEMRRATGVFGGLRVKCRLFGDRGSELLYALGLLQHAAELLLECHVGETATELFQRNLEVLVVEELGVVETGAHHALIAVYDGIGALGTTIANHHELACQIALAVVDGEIALIGQHGFADDLVRDVRQEHLVEGAHQHARPFAKIDHLVEDLRRRVHMRAASQVLDGLNPLGDHLTTALLGEHARALKHLFIHVGVGDNMVARPKNAMATRGIAARHIGVLHRITSSPRRAQLST